MLKKCTNTKCNSHWAWNSKDGGTFINNCEEYHDVEECSVAITEDIAEKDRLEFSGGLDSLEIKIHGRPELNMKI